MIRRSVSLYFTAALFAGALISACAPHAYCSGPACFDVFALLLYNPAPALGAFEPLYPGLSNWNQYVLRDNVNPLKLSGTPCPAPPVTASNQCLNGAFLRAVPVYAVAGCADLSARDSLDAFDWQCDDSTLPVRFVMAGFKTGRGLGDIIDFSTGQFKNNAVVVNRYVLGSFTRHERWWTNPILFANSGMAAATSVSDTIYLISQNPNATYVLDQARVTLVGKPGVRISGTPATPGQTLVSVSGNEVWIEGDFELADDSTAISVNAASRTVINRVRVQNGTGGAAAVLLTNARGALLKDIRVANTTATAVDLDGASFNALRDLTVGNLGNQGVRFFNASQRNALAGLVAVGSFTNGALMLSPDVTLANVTAVGFQSRAMVAAATGSNSVALNFLGANTAFSGLEISANSMLFRHAAGLATDTFGFALSGAAAGNQFRGRLYVGANLSGLCDNSAGVGAGFVTVTCTDSGAEGSSVYTGNASDALLTFVSAPGDAFVGLSGDARNASANPAGQASYASVGDWLDFENDYRLWARLAASPVDPALRTACAAASDCAIYDWSLRASAANPFLNAVAGDILEGAQTHVYSDASVQTFLKGAVEFLGDNYGDDDALCESGERCLVTPNVGAYQGHGFLLPRSLATPASVAPVYLYQYASNGR